VQFGPKAYTHSYSNTYFYSDGYTDRFSTTYSYA
jgi:hypothetical protein